MVLFLCRNKSFRNWTKLLENYFGIYKNYWNQGPLEGGLAAHKTPGRATPLWRALVGGGALGAPADPNSDAIKSYFSRKIGEEVSSHFTIQSRRHLLFFIGRPDLEPVRGSGEGDSSPSSSSTILHHQFHDAHRRQ